MTRKNFVSRALIILCLVLSIEVRAANMRNYIEAVRRKAAVVYVGSVREVQELSRNKFDIKARAVVSVSAVARASGAMAAQAIVEYSSYDDKTPMLAGGPQYQLRPGAMVLVFADSFESRVPPKYLLQGSREELLERVMALRDTVKRMSGDELKRNEIDEQDREVQLALYDRLTGYLGPGR